MEKECNYTNKIINIATSQEGISINYIINIILLPFFFIFYLYSLTAIR